MVEDGAERFDEPATIHRPKLDSEAALSSAFLLNVIEGPDNGQSFTLDASQPTRTLIGQSPACEIRLSDREVSRRHAALELVGRRLRLTDLGSTNGTFVDGVAVVEALLRGDEIVRLGSTALRVEPVSSAPAATLPAATRFGRVIGSSAEMRRLYPLCERLAASSVPVVIEGETGTGKELLAESLHEEGPRASGPFVVFDCTAVPPSLIEAELFGHERGAFTGAVNTRRGLLELAHGGTLLIDEIGDLEQTLQPKLLRAIERAELRRVGGERSIRVDVRFIAATRRNLDREVQTGRFRDDLFHRLAVARIELPPLRRRHGDVTLLARHFARQLGGAGTVLPGDLLLRWEDYDWPGNVRELRNAVARFLALGDLARLGNSLGSPAVADPEDEIEQVLALDLPFTEARRRVMDEFQRRYIERLLAQHDGSVAKAAEAAGIARRYFQLLRARTAK